MCCVWKQTYQNSGKKKYKTRKDQNNPHVLKKRKTLSLNAFTNEFCQTEGPGNFYFVQIVLGSRKRIAAQLILGGWNAMVSKQMRTVKNNVGSHCTHAQPKCTDLPGCLEVPLSRWRGLLRDPTTSLAPSHCGGRAV